MRQLIAATGLVLVLPLIGAAPAAAQIYPWCSIYSGTRGGAENCGFSTYAQCMANVSGIGGFCTRNPLYPERRRPPRSSRGQDRR